jgi:hypothetical protein
MSTAMGQRVVEVKAILALRCCLARKASRMPRNTHEVWEDPFSGWSGVLFNGYDPGMA